MTRSRIVLCIVDPFVGPDVPIARITETTIEPISVTVPIAPECEALIDIVLSDLREVGPSLDELPASVGPQIVWADTGRQT